MTTFSIDFRRRSIFYQSCTDKWSSIENLVGIKSNDFKNLSTPNRLVSPGIILFFNENFLIKKYFQQKNIIFMNKFNVKSTENVWKTNIKEKIDFFVF